MWCLYCALFSYFVYRYLCADMMFGMLCFVLLLSFPEKRKKKKEEKNPPTAPDRFAQTWFNCIFSRHTNMVTWWIKKERQSYIFKQGFYSLHAVWHCLTTLNVIHLAWNLTTFLEARQNKERKAVYIFMLFSDDALFCTLRLLGNLETVKVYIWYLCVLFMGQWWHS